MNILLHKLQYYFSLATLYFKEGTTIETGFTTVGKETLIFLPKYFKSTCHYCILQAFSLKKKSI